MAEPGRSPSSSRPSRPIADRSSGAAPARFRRCTTSGSSAISGCARLRSSRYLPHSSSTMPAPSSPAVRSPCAPAGPCAPARRSTAAIRSNGTARSTAAASAGESAITCPVPCGSSTASPGPSSMGEPPSGSSQQLPSSTMWNPAPSYGASRVHQLPPTRNRSEEGRPIRTAEIASLTTSIRPG